MSGPRARRHSFIVLPALVGAWVSACGGAPAPKSDTPLAVGSGNAPAVTAPKAPASEAELAVPIFPNDAVRGPRDALVTLVVFSDFQCPFCSRFARTLDEVREAYPNDLRIVFKNNPLPFHEHARRAAEIGAAVLELAGADAFWRYHDRAFGTQSRDSRGMSDEVLRSWAVEQGVDRRVLDTGLAQGRWAAKIEGDVALAAKLGLSGTPMTLVNGVAMSGAQPAEVVKRNIDAQLEKAKAVVASGVARDAVYARVVAENLVAKPAPKDEDDEKEDTSAWKVPVGTSPVRGKNDALVTVVVFSDFQCPYCKRVEPTLDRVRTEYGDRVRIVWKDEPLPFHPRAVPAAKLARFARAQKGDAAFWTMHDKLFESQPALEDGDLEKVAKAAGLDTKAAMAAVRATTTPKDILADEDLGDEVQASGTPHMFINGRRLVGAQPFEKFKSVIDEELTKAEALVRAGTAKSAVYEATIKNGKSHTPETKQVAVDPKAPFRGAANAKLVIQEFADFQCPFCSRVEPTLDDLMKAFPGKVKIVWRNLPLPFHADAPLAAEAAREAYVQKGNDGFAKMRELLFAHQRDQDGLKRPALEGYAREAKLDMAKFDKALDEHTHQAFIESEKKVAEAAGISGTPAFTVGPYYVSGAQPYTKFRKLAERVLGESAKPLPAKAEPKAETPTAPSPTLGAGLVVKDTAAGTGAAAKSGDRVRVHYVGRLTDGTEFDSSRKHGSGPFTFELGKGRVIKGWDQGVVGMKVGGKRTLTIPPDLAYGERGAGAAIPPNATLVFDVELIAIDNP